MRKVGSDFKYMLWVFAGLALAFPLVFLLPLSVPFIIGSGLFFFGAKKINSYKNLKTWVKTEGTLLQADIGGYDEMDDYSKNGKNEYYLPLANFSYSWKGSKKESNNYSFDSKSIWSLDPEDIIRKIKDLESLEKLEVYVNPKNPREAVLNIEVSKNRYSHAYAVLASGVLIIILGMVLLIKT